MAGHSKWKNIQHKKGRADAARGKLFAKLAKEVYVAALQGGTDPDSNASLRLAISKARSNSMPNDNIKRAIDRASGNKDGSNFEEILYEGYGPHGVAFLIYCLSDNRNRIASFVKATFNKRGGQLGADGSVSYLFNKVSYIFINKEDITIDLEELELELIDFGVEEIEELDNEIVLAIETKDLKEITKNLENHQGINKISHYENKLEPTLEVELTKEQQEKVHNMIEYFEDNEDVQTVYTNLKED